MGRADRLTSAGITGEASQTSGDGRAARRVSDVLADLLTLRAPIAEGAT
jgi:hypothetical protein